MMVTALVVIQVCAALLAATWIFYPLVMWLVGRREKSSGNPRSGGIVSAILATRDDPERTARRVANLRACVSEATELQIVVGIDPGSRFQFSDYQSQLGPDVVLVRGDEPGGKAATLNAAVRNATGQILVFCDCGQRFEDGAIENLAAQLNDRRVGAATGMLLQESDSPVLDAFWRMNVAILRGQARLHSVVSVSGAVYAMRRELWRDLPSGVICDDLFVTLSTVATGHRVVFCRNATAFDGRRFAPEQHFNRKVRTVTGLLQFCRLAPWALDPRRNPVWIHFVLHKLLRFATPFLVGIIVVLGAVRIVPGSVLFPAVFALGGVLLALVITAEAGAGRPSRVARSLLWIAALQAVPLAAARNALKGRWDVWQAHAEAVRPAALND